MPNGAIGIVDSHDYNTFDQRFTLASVERSQTYGLCRRLGYRNRQFFCLAGRDLFFARKLATAEFCFSLSIEEHVVPIDRLDRLVTEIFDGRFVDKDITSRGLLVFGGDVRGIRSRLAFDLVNLSRAAALCIFDSFLVALASTRFIEVLDWTTERISFPVDSFLDRKSTRLNSSH